MSPRTLERTTDAKVDPRIAARRDAVAADRRRRRRRWALVAIVVVAVVGGGWFVTRTSLLDVASVEVEGAVRTSPDDIRVASGVAVGDPLVDVDGGSVDAAVERLPWVATAETTRRLDGTVTIAVTERAPVATVPAADGARALVDRDGRVLAVVAPDSPEPPDPALVTIDGVVAGAPGEVLPPAGAGALAVVDGLTPGLRARVVAVVVSPIGELTLALRPEGTVDLGPPTELDVKLERLITVLSQVDQSGLAVIGLRVPDLPTVTRR